MAGLLKSLPPRTTRQSDAAVIAKTSKTAKPMAPVVKGGKSIYDRIATAVALVATKLGKYSEKFVLLRDEESVADYFRAIISYGSGAIDTETTSLDPLTCEIVGIPLYVPGKKSAYIPINHVSYITGVKTSNQVSPEYITSWLEKCKEANVKWIMHNAGFDTRVIHHTLGIRVKCFWDTQLASKCIDSTESSKLKDLHLKFCDSNDKESLTYEKLFEGITFSLVPILTAYLYAAGDGIKTWEVYEYQKRILSRKTLPGIYSVFKNIEMPLIPVVAQMEDAGISIDRPFAEQLSIKYNAQLREREQAFYDLVDKLYGKEVLEYKSVTPNSKLSDPINISSPTQIAILLYDILKIHPPDKKKPRGTGEDIISKMSSPVARAILDYRQTAKLLSTYVDKLPAVINEITGRIHCSFNQYGADTGRFSSSDPNMQNIPSHNKEIRKMFKAAEGCVLISCDFSQQEPRTLAHASQDAELIKAYQAGKDIYAWIASSIYKRPYEECKEKHPDGTANPEGKKIRDGVKSVILGIMYGRGAKTIGEQLEISAKEAQKIIDLFFKTFPVVRKWMDEVVAGVHKNGYVETLWGRRRYLRDMQLEPFEIRYAQARAIDFDPLDFNSATQITTEVEPKIKAAYIKRLNSKWSNDERQAIIREAREQGIIIRDNGAKLADAERQCVNTVIQGSSADMTKLAMISIGNDEFLKERKCQLLLQVHDEVIAECPEEYAKECADRLCDLMVAAAKEKISVPMKCDAEITYVWYGDPIEV